MHSFIRRRSAIGGVALGALACPVRRRHDVGPARTDAAAPTGPTSTADTSSYETTPPVGSGTDGPLEHRLLRLVEPERLQPGGLRRHQPGGRRRRQRHGEIFDGESNADPVQPDRGRRRLGPLRRLRHRAQRPGRHRRPPRGAQRRSDGDGAVPIGPDLRRSSRNRRDITAADPVSVQARAAARTSSRSAPTSIPAAPSSSSASCSSRSTTSGCKSFKEVPRSAPQHPNVATAEGQLLQDVSLTAMQDILQFGPRVRGALLSTSPAPSPAPSSR